VIKGCISRTLLIGMPPGRKIKTFKGESKVSGKAAFIFVMNANADDNECAFCNKTFSPFNKDKDWGVFDCFLRKEHRSGSNYDFYVCPHCKLHDAAAKFIKENLDEEILLQSSDHDQDLFVVDSYEEVTYGPKY
jgi:hypothetical protein